MSRTKKEFPRVGITIRFRDREQVDLLKRAAAHRLISFNTFVREAAEAVAQEVLSKPPGLNLLNQNGSPPSIPSHQGHASFLFKQNSTNEA